MKIALVVDNPYRDLPGLVLLATELGRRGAVCYLVSMSHTNELLPLTPDFVLLNYLRVNNEALAARLLEAGIEIGVLDTEGGVLPSMDHYAQTLARDSSLRHCISCYCTWGPKMAEEAERAGWYRAEQIVTTGAPRLDFYRAPWREAVLRTSEQADEYPQPVVLCNGNFPLTNPRFQTAEEEARMLVERFGYPQARVSEWQEKNERAMHELVALTNGLARRFPHVTFIYRPHPFERLETYEPLLEKLGNLHLVKAGTVDGWILRSVAVIQRSCSTAVEAGLAGVPALSPNWIVPTVDMPVAEAVSLQCDTEREMVSALERILAGEFSLPPEIQLRLDEVITDWFYKVDGFSHVRVADVVVRSLNGRIPQPGAYRGGSNPRATQRQIWHGRLTTALGLPTNWSFRRMTTVERDLSPWRASEKYFSVKQVTELVNAIQSCAAGSNGRQPWSVGVQSAQERGDFESGYTQGQAVTVFPKPELI